MSVAARAPGGVRRITVALLAVSDVTAAVLLVADLLVVCVSVLLRFLFNAPVEWADDVARGLMVGSSFFGAASALARSENLGVAFFIDMLPGGVRRVVDAMGALLVTIIAGYVACNGIKMGWLTTGQTSGSGLPLEWTFYPMGAGALFMTVFAFELFCARPIREGLAGIIATAIIAGVYLAWDFLSPSSVPSSSALMLVGFFLTLFGGLPIGFALALAALIFIWVEGTLPGVIFAQQMARGIDNFVLLAIPFFILVGYLMEANGMSVRLIELLQRAVGRMRGGLNVVMVTSMVLFSGISGSKMADVAAVGSVLIPAARRSRQNPGSAVALLAASAVMAETIPPCINLIILGFVANLSIGGLFVAGILPAGLMALALIVLCIILGKPRRAGRRGRAADSGFRPLERRDRLVRADLHDLLRLQERLCDRDRNLGLCRGLCHRHRQHRVPRTQLQGRRAQFRAIGDALGAGAVHRRRRAIAGVHPDAAAGAACGRRHHALAVGIAGRLAVHAAVDRGADRDGLGSGRRGGADHLRAAAAAGGGQARHRSPAFRRRACHFDGARPVRTAARPRALRRLPDRQRADRTDHQADHGLSRSVAAVPSGDRLRAFHQHDAAARLWVLT